MVEFQPSQYQQQGAPQGVDPWQFIDSVGGNKSLVWVTKDEYGRDSDLPIGSWYEGTVVGTPKVRQQLDFITKEPKFYNDGNPMNMLQVDLQTNLRDDAEDDGVRALYLRNQSLRALQDEMRARGVKQFGEGSYLKITLVNLKPTTKGNPQKIFEISLQPTPVTDPQVNAMLSGAPQGAPAQQPVYQQPQQQYAPQGAPQFQQPVYAQPAPVQQPMQAPPVQQFPQQPPAGAAAALAAGYQEIPAQAAPVQAPVQAPPVQQAQQQAPAAPVAQFGVPVVTQQMVDQVNLLINQANFPREAAIASVAQNDPALIQALDPNIPF